MRGAYKGPRLSAVALRGEGYVPLEACSFSRCCVGLGRCVHDRQCRAADRGDGCHNRAGNRRDRNGCRVLAGAGRHRGRSGPDEDFQEGPRQSHLTGGIALQGRHLPKVAVLLYVIFVLLSLPIPANATQYTNATAYGCGMAYPSNGPLLGYAPSRAQCPAYIQWTNLNTTNCNNCVRFDPSRVQWNGTSYQMWKDQLNGSGQITAGSYVTVMWTNGPSTQTYTYPPTGQCTAGNVLEWKGTALPSAMQYCYAGCTYTLAPVSGNADSQGGGTALQQDGTYIGNSFGTGDSCSPENPPPVPNFSGCVQNGSDVMCLGETPHNCGTLNGVQYCAPEIPNQGVCLLVSGAGFICNGATPPNIVKPDGSQGPPQQSGTISGPNASGTGVQTGTVYNYTNSNTVIQNTSGGGGCGGTGEPPCKIDESGTPDQLPENAYDSKLQGLDEWINNLGTAGNVGTGNGSMDGVNPLSNVTATSCDTLTVGVPPHTFTFPPPPDGCAKLETFKGIMAWVFYIFTAFYLIGLASRRPV